MVALGSVFLLGRGGGGDSCIHNGFLVGQVAFERRHLFRWVLLLLAAICIRSDRTGGHHAVAADESSGNCRDLF